MRMRTAVTAALAVLAAVPAASCGRDGGDGDGTARSPFTGREVDGERPTLIVKIDNVQQARPAVGLSDADIVYVEPVEGGLSRLLAVYSSKLPRTVGPVRSARESDLELLAQFGRPALAYSGANAGVNALVHDSPVIDVSPDAKGGAYTRENSRPPPHNLFVRPDTALQDTDATNAHDIGFRFGAAPRGGRPDTGETVSYDAARFDIAWSAARRHWTVSMDSAPPVAGLAPSTVVIQHVAIRNSQFSDIRGAPSPYVQSVGSGEATVLRDGRAYRTRWSRTEGNGGTTFTTTSGERMRFATGQVWVLFAP